MPFKKVFVEKKKKKKTFSYLANFYFFLNEPIFFQPKENTQEKKFI